ncbi:MAG: putative transcriptional regulator, CopG family [Myxococcaceae bacterium]|nr:putative transcriptional regulator, CopG family [Myxococcaceae bacterium]
MKTVQMTLDEELVAEVDRAVRRLKTTRSAFARQALRAALQTLATRELDRRHREGYRKKPEGKDEFSVWEKEHAWGDE